MFFLLQKDGSCNCFFFARTHKLKKIHKNTKEKQVQDDNEKKIHFRHISMKYKTLFTFNSFSILCGFQMVMIIRHFTIKQTQNTHKQQTTGSFCIVRQSWIFRCSLYFYSVAMDLSVHFGQWKFSIHFHRTIFQHFPFLFPCMGVSIQNPINKNYIHSFRVILFVLYVSGFQDKWYTILLVWTRISEFFIAKIIFFVYTNHVMVYDGLMRFLVAARTFIPTTFHFIQRQIMKCMLIW